jgi:hypothetical protein
MLELKLGKQLLPFLIATLVACGSEDVDPEEMEEDSTEQAALAVKASERMTDRCSAEVAIVPSYNDGPATPGTIILKRDASGGTAWTAPFNIKLGGSGHIRWWCHSTTGNVFDPGTWRVDELYVGTTCDADENGLPSNCRVKPKIKLGSSAWEGWTAERSRCNDRSTKVRARLGKDRLLQIECLGR